MLGRPNDKFLHVLEETAFEDVLNESIQFTQNRNEAHRVTLKRYVAIKRSGVRLLCLQAK